MKSRSLDDIRPKAPIHKRMIYCTGCESRVKERLTDGKEIYPHRADLASLPFWKCDTCHNYVGCHHKTKNRTQPLGCIPTKELKNARQHIHRLLDPLWQSGILTRKEVSLHVADALGIKKYHTANIRSIEEARNVYQILLGLKRWVDQERAEA